MCIMFVKCMTVSFIYSRDIYHTDTGGSRGGRETGHLHCKSCLGGGNYQIITGYTNSFYSLPI